MLFQKDSVEVSTVRLRLGFGICFRLTSKRPFHIALEMYHGEVTYIRILYWMSNIEFSDLGCNYTIVISTLF